MNFNHKLKQIFSFTHDQDAVKDANVDNFVG